MLGRWTDKACKRGFAGHNTNLHCVNCLHRSASEFLRLQLRRYGTMGLRRLVAALLLSALMSAVNVRSSLSLAMYGCPENALTGSLQTAIKLAIAGNASADGFNLTLYSQHVVCLATAERQGEYSSASVVVSFHCIGSLQSGSPLGPFCLGNYTSQMDLECNATLQWVPSTMTVHFFEVAHATFSTNTDFFCSRCVDPAFPDQLLSASVVDPETHCSSECLHV